MSSKDEIDKLDISIIRELQKDARMHFKKIAAKLGVAEGTIRNRTNRLIRNGVLILEARVNPIKFENSIAALVGLRLKERNQQEVMKKIKKIPGITSVWNSAGRYDLFFEVMTDSLEELNLLLFGENQGLEKIGGILSSETFILLESYNKYYKIK